MDAMEDEQWIVRGDGCFQKFAPLRHVGGRGVQKVGVGDDDRVHEINLFGGIGRRGECR